MYVFALQQVCIVAAVRLVAGCAALLEGGLVMHAFLELLGMSVWQPRQMSTAFGFGKPRLLTGVGAVAIRAVARRARMRHFRRLDLLGLVGVADHAK